MELLALRQGGTITKEMIFAQMYAGIDQPAMKIIDVYICKLRKKLADASGGPRIHRNGLGPGLCAPRARHSEDRDVATHMDELERARRRLLEKAFALASSGQHRDHRTILAELRSSHEYPLARFDIESPAVLKQFDMICVESGEAAGCADDPPKANFGRLKQLALAQPTF